MCTSHEDQYTIFITFRSVLLRMRNVSDKCWRETQNTYFTFNNLSFSENVPFMRKCGKLLQNWAGHRWQHGALASHAFP